MIKNCFLPAVPEDQHDVHLYHLAIEADSKTLKAMYGDVKFVIMGGKDSRMKTLAEKYTKFLNLDKTGENLVNLAEGGGRFSMFKVEHVLFLSHGMGVPSISIALHEVTKLLHYAGVKSASYIRVGSSGGLGVEPGTVVITNKCYSSKLTNDYEIYICGKLVVRPAILDDTMRSNFLNLAREKDPSLQVVSANTMCAMDFYEEQARVDGAVNEITEELKQQFLNELRTNLDIKNIEMECVQFGAFCNVVGVKGMIVCQTMVDRLQSDKVAPDYIDILAKEHRFFNILFQFISQV